MINSPFNDEEVKTSSESTIPSDKQIVAQPSTSKNTKSLLVTIGILVTASLSGYFGLMLLHNTLLPPNIIPNPNPNLAKPASTIIPSPSSVIKSSEAMDSDDLSTIQNTTQSHQIALKFKNGTKSLDRVINKIVKHCKTNNFSTESLSISLIDIKTNERVGYQNELSRYPASVVKMFWLFNLYDAQPIAPTIQGSIDKMILKSDNNGASQVLDYITKTKSALPLIW